MSILFAFTPRDGAVAEWYYARTPNEVISVPAEELSSHKADRIVWLVPGTDVLLSEVEATTRSVADLRVAGLYQLEDDLSEQVSRLHIALGDKSTEQPSMRDVAVISRARLDGILAQVNEYPEEIAAAIELVPETSLFKATGTPFIYDGDDRVLLGDGLGFAEAVDPALAPDLLPALIHQMAVKTADIYTGSHAVLPAIQMPATFTGTDIEPISFAQFVSSPLLAGEGINLRQAEYAPKRQLKIGVSGWTGTMVLAGLVFVAWIGVSAVSVFQLQSETDKLYERMVDAYTNAYPSEGAVADPRRAVAQKLGATANGSSGPGFIDLASVFYAGLREVEGVQLDGFSYDQSTGRLTATLRFSGYQDRDQLKQIFDRQGVPITLGGARQENGMLVGEAILGDVIS